MYGCCNIKVRFPKPYYYFLFTFPRMKQKLLNNYFLHLNWTRFPDCLYACKTWLVMSFYISLRVPSPASSSCSISYCRSRDREISSNDVVSGLCHLERQLCGQVPELRSRVHGLQVLPRFHHRRDGKFLGNVVQDAAGVHDITLLIQGVLLRVTEELETQEALLQRRDSFLHHSENLGVRGVKALFRLAVGGKHGRQEMTAERVTGTRSVRKSTDSCG